MVWGATLSHQITQKQQGLSSLADLQLVALEIKNMLSAAISDLKTDLRTVASRFERIESAVLTHGTAI